MTSREQHWLAPSWRPPSWMERIRTDARTGEPAERFMWLRGCTPSSGHTLIIARVIEETIDSEAHRPWDPVYSQQPRRSTSPSPQSVPETTTQPRSQQQSLSSPTEPTQHPPPQHHPPAISTSIPPRRIAVTDPAEYSPSGLPVPSTLGERRSPIIEMCSICLSGVWVSTEEHFACPLALPGQQVSHCECLDRSLRVSSKCPICRRELSLTGVMLLLPGDSDGTLVFPEPTELQFLPDPHPFPPKRCGKVSLQRLTSWREPPSKAAP